MSNGSGKSGSWCGGATGRVGILLAVSLTLWALAAPVAGYWGGGAGLAAATAAMGVCLLGGLLALGISWACRPPELALLGVALGMFVRMGVPLAGLLALILAGGVLVEGGVAYYLLVFYPVMLAVETALSVAAIQGAASAS